jgi:hypothetical protein
MSLSAPQRVQLEAFKHVSFEPTERKLYGHDIASIPALVRPLIGNTIPDGVKITNFQISSANLVTVTGTAQSIAQVSTFSKALEDYNVDFKPQPGFDRKPFFTTVNITTVSKDETTGQVNFTITFKADESVFNKAPSS